MSMHSYSAEGIMNTFWEYQEAGHLDESLEAFRSLSHDPSIIDYTLDPNSYYYPEVRNGEVTKPESAPENAIPVIALEANHSYNFGLPKVHALQRIAMLGAGMSQSDIDTVNALSGSPMLVSPNKGGYGSVRSGSVETKADGSRVIVQTTPIVIFNASRNDHPAEDFIGTAMHELVHVTQFLEKPLDSCSDRKVTIERELEAHGVTSRLFNSYKVPYTDSIRTAATIENFRQRHMPDSFAPTDEFLHFAERDELVAQVIRPIE